MVDGGWCGGPPRGHLRVTFRISRDNLPLVSMQKEKRKRKKKKKLSELLELIVKSLFRRLTTLRCCCEHKYLFTN